MQISPDGKNIAYLIKDDNGYYLVTNQKKYGPYEYGCYNIKFSSDNNKPAYAVYLNDGVYVINDEQKLGPYKKVSNIQFSKDSKKIIFASYINDDKSLNLFFHEMIYTRPLQASLCVRNEKKELMVGSIYKNKVAYLQDGKVIVEAK